MGGAYVALARGIEAARWNPANLGLGDPHGFSFNLASIAAGGHNNAFGKADYDLYNGAYLTPRDKATLIQQVPDDGLKANVASEIDLLGFSVYRLALLAGVDVISDVHLSRSFFEIALNGNGLNRRYDFSSTGGAGMAVSTVGLALGVPIRQSRFDDFAVGATVKYVRGLAAAEVIEAVSNLETSFDGFIGEAHATVLTALGGNGYALDVGTAATVNNRLAVGLTLRNVISNVNWNRKVKEYTVGITTDSLTTEVLATTDADSLISDYSEEREAEAFQRRLPTVLHLGATYNWGRLILTGDFIQMLSNPLNMSATPELRFGMELRLLRFLPLRAGAGLGGQRGTSSAVGFGFDFGGLDLDFAAGTWGGFFPKQGRGLGAAFGIRAGL